MAYNPELAEQVRHLVKIARIHLYGESLSQFEDICEKIHIELTRPHLTLEDLIKIYLEPIESNLKSLIEKFNSNQDVQTRIEIEHHHAQKLLLESIINHFAHIKETEHDTGEEKT